MGQYTQRTYLLGNRNQPDNMCHLRPPLEDDLHRIAELYVSIRWGRAPGPGNLPLRTGVDRISAGIVVRGETYVATTW